MTRRELWDVTSTGLVAVAALTMLGFYLHDRAGLAANSLERHVSGWEDWAETGIRVGPEDATVVIATFVDFECPFCKSLAPVLDSVLTEFPGYVVLEFHHFPLSSHAAAVPSAIAAECAARQGKFTHMYHTLYAQIDSVGKKPWGALAADAKIEDIPAFEACAQLPPEAFARIAAGRELGQRIGVKGTPTVYVNGTLFSGRSVAEFRDKARHLGIGRKTAAD